MSNQEFCPQCKSPLSSTDKFCPNCGTKVEQEPQSSKSISPDAKSVVCETCGRANPVSSTVCEGCGSELTVNIKQKVQEETHRSAKPVSKKQKSKEISPLRGGKPSTYVIAGFAVLVLVFVVLEFRDSPTSQGTRVNSSSRQTQSEPSLLNDIASLENIIKSEPNNSGAMLQLANKLHDAKFFPRAIEAYKSFLKLQPKNTDARVDLGICYFETGDSKQAIQEIESALKLEPKHQMAMFNLGIIHLSSGNLTEAKKWFKKCVDIDPASTAGARAKELLQQHSQ